jgi:hypothetical protein
MTVLGSGVTVKLLFLPLSVLNRYRGNRPAARANRKSVCYSRQEEAVKRHWYLFMG